MTRNKTPARAVAALAGALMLSACASFSPDGGMSVTADIASRELRKDVVAIRTDDAAAAARAQIERALKRSLTADAAVQIALLNNRGLQAAYNELGIAETAMMRESLPPNPTLSVERLSGPLEIEIEKRIVGNILAIATLPARADIARDRFLQAQQRAAEDTLRIAAATRRAYYRAVASGALAGFLQQAQSAAETAAKLAQRLGETGALNKIDQAREQVFYAEVTAQLAVARQKASSDRERLVRLLGLWGNDLAFKLPGSLPSLPRSVAVLRTIEIEAVRRRIDLQMARQEVATLAKLHGLTQATRFINLLEVGGVAKTKIERTTGERVRDRGVDVEFQIPIFDLGEVRSREASETYLRAVNQLTEKAVNVRSEARDTYRNYRSSYDIARHYRDEVLPLRKIISDETLLRYNAMQIDVFALLAEARQRVAANAAAIDAQRQFWLAAVDLSVAVVGGGVSADSGDRTTMTTAAPDGAAGH